MRHRRLREIRRKAEVVRAAWGKAFHGPPRPPAPTLLFRAVRPPAPRSSRPRWRIAAQSTPKRGEGAFCRRLTLPRQEMMGVLYVPPQKTTHPAAARVFRLARAGR